MKILNSVRSRLTLWYVGVLALVLIAFAALTYLLVVRVLTRETDDNLTAMAENFKVALESELSGEDEKSSLEKSIQETVNESRFHDYDFIVYADNSPRPIASTNSRADLNALLPNLNDAAPFFATVKVGGETFRVRALPLAFGATDYRLFVARSLDDQAKFLNRLQTIFFVIVPLALALAGFGGYFLACRSLAPVVEMSRQAAGISATNLHERLLVKNERDELGHLAQVFNSLLLRLENSFEQQRRFMADASHELRTPLSIVRGESEIALSKTSRSNADYRESLAIVHDESRRLTKIVEDLFTLARADAGQFRLNFAEIYLDEILIECLRAVRTLAEKRRISLEFAAGFEMPMRGDEQLLRRLFINLLDNAIKYNRDGGRVSVTGEKTPDAFEIKITDTGAGIPENARPKIFDRFYRADEARSRSAETETSGAGLGLSIAKWIAEIHRGQIRLASSDAGGSVFVVVFPLEKILHAPDG